jgi:DNA-binding SARP family transcriptional activator
VTVELRLLGTPLVLVDGGPPSADLEWKKHKALLIYLACSGDRARSRDHLGELLWPSGNTARSLSQGLVPIRKALGDEGVESDGDIVRLKPGSLRLDLDDVRRLAAAGEWSRAATIVRGQFCEGLAIKGASSFEDWLSTHRLQWRPTAVGILVHDAERLVAEGDLNGALIQFHRASDIDPLAEPALRGLMRALALDDQRNAALEEYHLFLKRLADTLGGEASPELRSLADRLLGTRPRQERNIDPLTSRRAPLVGRSLELVALLELWRMARGDRRPVLATVTGDAGSGKSRLAEEISSRVRLEGATVAAVRLVPADRQSPDCVILGLARGGLLDARGLTAAPPEALASLARRLPEWADRYPGGGASSLNLGEAVGQVLRTVAEEEPVLLLVDDVQWSEPAALDALDALLRDLEHHPLLLLLVLETGTDDGVADRLRSRVGRDRPGKTLRLLSLSLPEVHELTRWGLPNLGEEQVARVARRVYADSAGLPFIAIELLHALALGLDLGRVKGAWPEPFRTLTQTLPGGLPDSVVAALRVGFRRLSLPAQSVLRVLAVVNEKISAQLLVPLLECGANEVDSALDELEWQRWLNADAQGYTFVARIAREVILQDMTTPGQRERVATAWRRKEAHPGSSGGPPNSA